MPVTFFLDSMALGASSRAMLHAWDLDTTCSHSAGASPYLEMVAPQFRLNLLEDIQDPSRLY